MNETNRLDERNVYTNCGTEMCVIVTHKYQVTQFLCCFVVVRWHFFHLEMHFISQFNVPFIHISVGLREHWLPISSGRWCEKETEIGFSERI